MTYLQWRRRGYVRLAIAGWTLLSGLQIQAFSTSIESIAFPFDAATFLIDEDNFGIVNGRISAGVNYKSVGDIQGLYAPPFVSSDFFLRFALNGSPVPTAQGTWLPWEVTRFGVVDGVTIESSTLLFSGAAAGEIAFRMTSDSDKTVEFQLEATGTLDLNQVWEFARPVSESPSLSRMEGDMLLLEQGNLAIALAVIGAENIAATEGSNLLTASLPLTAASPTTVRVAFAMGRTSDVEEVLGTWKQNPESIRLDSVARLGNRAQGLLDRLPSLESDNAALMRLYNRSLVHMITNRWEVPQFVLNPYYATGSIKGGCVCNYLWNYGENWEIMPLFDPEAVKTHIKQFLSINLTEHFAFLPITGEGFGPWYMVNQEKILGSIYYYVLLTGDTAFLDEAVDGKTVYDLVLYHAQAREEDPKSPVELIDYGPSNSHLELRREYAYNHVMPDLNGRRYTNYWYAARTCELAGRPQPFLMERAEALRAKLHDELWDPEAKWFAFRNGEGQMELRYTIQLFKLFNNPILTPESEAGLLSHLNETEFLGEYGLHSMSKTDPAYDAVDIDNGGGGACTCFPPQIAERLYKAGHPQQADDILRRILWWGEHLPYWGDSIVADKIDYRKDTPLQCTFDGLTVAQSIIFGVCGVNVNDDGTVRVAPRLPSFCNELRLKNVQVRGQTFDVNIQKDEFSVNVNGDVMMANEGTWIDLPANQ
ncbi:MAG: hypothetical protein AMXMBFR84_13410 [Candidatus Hydrogenedentota bacterium]